MAINTLYIIGNGFDLAHGMATRYGDFRKWLIKNGRIDVIQELQSAFPSRKENNYLLWSDFEKALGRYDIDKVINWSWEDLCITVYSDSSRLIRNSDFFLNPQLIDILSEAFTAWIRSIPLANTPIDFNPKQEAYYLTFNYTDTLEVLYDIPNSLILHIHGRASQKEKLIVGHNREIDPSDYCDNNSGMRENNERMQRLTDMNNLRKPYHDIIDHNSAFFHNLNYVHDIQIIGHSCAEVDLPYFHKIKESIDVGAIWHFTPYCEEDKVRIQKFVQMMGIDYIQTTGIYF